MLQKRIFGVILVGLLLCTSCVSTSSGSSDGATKASGSSKLAHLFEWTGNPDYKSPKHVPVHPSYMSNQLAGLKEDWYKDSSVYHIWVKSFNDYDGDGIGDFRGITEKLDYIKNDVGCDTLWLSPIFDCSGKGTAVNYNMHGYDTIDYYEVNDYFGNEEHLMTLLEEAHKRNMKVIFDFVPNHTSNAHPWFILSGKREDGKNDWYLWNEERLKWNPMGSSNTWFQNVDRHQYYYGAFNSGMPDLNFRNYEVREEMKNVVRYWLNKGFDGVRIDAVRYLVEEDGAVVRLMDTEETHKFFEELRDEVMDPYAELGYPKFMVCEAWIGGNRSWLNRYYGTEEKPEFHMVFDFDFQGRLVTSTRFNNPAYFDYVRREFTSKNNPVHYGTFLSNHDNLSNRPGTLFKELNDLRFITGASLLLPSTPFIYYANEIGQEDEPNLQGRDIRLRYPLKWEEVDKQLNDKDSILRLHKDLNTLRRQYPALTRGQVEVQTVQGDSELFAYTLTHENQTLLCVFNFSSNPQADFTIQLQNEPSTYTLLYTTDDSAKLTLSSGILHVSELGSRTFAVLKL